MKSYPNQSGPLGTFCVQPNLIMMHAPRNRNKSQNIFNVYSLNKRGYNCGFEICFKKIVDLRFKRKSLRI